MLLTTLCPCVCVCVCVGRAVSALVLWMIMLLNDKTLKPSSGVYIVHLTKFLLIYVCLRVCVQSAWIFKCAGSTTTSTLYGSSARKPNANIWDNSETYSAADSVLLIVHTGHAELHHWPFNHGGNLSTAAAKEMSKRSHQGGRIEEPKILLTDCQRLLLVLLLLLLSIFSQNWNRWSREHTTIALQYILPSLILQKLLS